MVDVARDPRWGRVVEGAGEDPYLGAALAAARTRGLRSGSLADASLLLATAKHFVAYGAAEAGRDYNTVDISERTLHELYLPPFRAAIEAGVDSIMPAFNELAGVPMHGHAPLTHGLLRNAWGFRGIVVSDYTGIRELIPHGYAANETEAALRGMAASVDIDMVANVYGSQLPALVRAGKISERALDAAVRRVLEAKQRLGLFEDPYRYSDEAREREHGQRPESMALAREAAQKSIVLLKNERALLPLSKRTASIALVGALAKDRVSPLGAWAAVGIAEQTVTVYEGLRAALPKASQLFYARGASPASERRDGIAAAVRVAKQAQVVIAVVGEIGEMSGEALSRGAIGLPGAQEALLKALVATGKPLVVLLMNGRPLALPEAVTRAPAVLETWFLGHQMGHAVADVLFGDVNPSGKLPMTFPRDGGQVPIYYNHKPTGRPPSEAEHYTSKYIDMPWTPLYPFGHGLSYTTFLYGAPQLDKEKLGPRDQLVVQVSLTNSGARRGEEVVQLYLRDDSASVTRPVRALRGFQRVALAPGEQRTLSFTLGPDDFALLDEQLERVVEAGTFTVFVGGSASAGQSASFEVTSSAKLSGLGPAIPREAR